MIAEVGYGSGGRIRWGVGEEWRMVARVKIRKTKTRWVGWGCPDENVFCE